MMPITFHRESVCMGDDAMNGEYRIEMPDDALLRDLMHVILRGSNGNDWPLPYTGADSHWIIESNIGNLAHIYTDSEGEWHTKYLDIAEDARLDELGIASVFGRRTVKFGDTVLVTPTNQKVLYSMGDIALLDVGGELCLRDGEIIYQVRSFPYYNPATYLLRDGDITATISNAFDESEIHRVVEKRKPIRAVTGTEYDADRLCRFLVFAARHCPNHDVGYVEGKMAIEKMKELGATSPETAVDMSELGVRTISDAFSHSKKLAERVMRTESGKVYVQIKE